MHWLTPASLIVTRYCRSTSNEPPDEAFRRARAAAEKALSLDNNLAEAHTSLGLVLHAADLNFEGAKQEFERAIELNPNYAGAHYFLGLVFRTARHVSTGQLLS